MRIFGLLGVLLVLAACGVDGEPEAPTMNGTVGLSTDGAFGAVSVTRGPVSISIGSGRGCYSCY
ncbi:hypothetical protein [uncultured Shimia sp.]|uniref:hypothetical protein n=1 Tax=uncultured Shimia sp. TaxID=573152 RepID=UPI002618EAB8|nr:hypothetical protein [uncultured Shimia sp.]